MMKKVIIISLVLVVTLPVSSCNGEELPSAEEIIDRAIAALENLETYRCDAEIDIEMTLEAEGETGGLTAGADYSGTMDITNYEMMINMDIDMTGTGELGEDMTMTIGAEMYLVNNTLYANIDMPFFMNGVLGSEWIKSEIPEDLMEQSIPTNQMDSLTQILELVEFKVTGTQIVNSADCYVLEFTPDPDELWELMMQQLQISEQMRDTLDTELELIHTIVDDIANNISVKLLIAKDTYFMTRIEFDISLDLTPEDLGEPEEEGRLRADITMIFDVYEINCPVSIELPPEASDAVEMPLGDMPW